MTDNNELVKELLYNAEHGAYVTSESARLQRVAAAALSAQAQPVALRERLEITNEHIGRLIHAFDGDRKELLRKIYKQNLFALASPPPAQRPTEGSGE